MTLGSLRRVDSRPIPDRGNEIRAFMLARNEALRLPATLRHLRDIGVDRVFVIDNDSTDATPDLLAGEPDVHVFLTAESFAATNFGLTWLHALLDTYGSGGWTLTSDADELLIYPCYEEIRLPELCRFLDQSGHHALFCLLLDMYSDKPIRATEYKAGDPLIAACPYFDSAPYRMVKAMSFPFVQIYGGVRERVFRHLQTRGFHSPTISKVPLVRWHPGIRYSIATHAVSPLPISDMMGALLHFKFLSDFPVRVESEARRGEHFDNAREYVAYRDRLREEEMLSFIDEVSVRFENSKQLVALGLMRSTQAYERFIADAEKARPTR